MNTLSEQFINFTISNQILKFGEFKTKAGRISPYFFNMGLINNGKDLKELGEFYRDLIKKNNITFACLDGVTDPRNIGSLIRSAASFDIDGIIIKERQFPDESKLMYKAASGAMNTLIYLKYLISILL